MRKDMFVTGENTNLTRPVTAVPNCVQAWRRVRVIENMMVCHR